MTVNRKYKEGDFKPPFYPYEGTFHIIILQLYFNNICKMHVSFFDHVNNLPGVQNVKPLLNIVIHCMICTFVSFTPLDPRGEEQGILKM